nr:4-oxalocrotonate tautomerase family protein [Rahnella bonaserana]
MRIKNPKTRLEVPFCTLYIGREETFCLRLIHNPEREMPYVNIKITRDGATAEQKKALIAGVTQLLVDTLGKNPATTTVIIDEIDTDNWGLGGRPVTELRQENK